MNDLRNVMNGDRDEKSIQDLLTKMTILKGNECGICASDEDFLIIDNVTYQSGRNSFLSKHRREILIDYHTHPISVPPSNYDIAHFLSICGLERSTVYLLDGKAYFIEKQKNTRTISDTKKFLRESFNIFICSYKNRTPTNLYPINKNNVHFVFEATDEMNQLISKKYKYKYSKTV